MSLRGATEALWWSVASLFRQLTLRFNQLAVLSLHKRLSRSLRLQCCRTRIVSSAEIERRLAPLYERLRLPAGRLELMTGIRERRFWPAGHAAQRQEHREQPASDRARRHRSAADRGACPRFGLPRLSRAGHGLRAYIIGLDLPRDCLIYDVSNACLGMLNGMVQVANMIELGQIRAGLVVGSEGSRQLVETTIDALNRDTSLTRDDVKLAVASLTIGSASCAVLLAAPRAQPHAAIACSAAWPRANTEFHDLCHSGADEAVASGMQPLMHTDSEQLMHEGIADRRRDIRWLPYDARLARQRHRQDVLPPGGRGPSQADARAAWA